MNTEISSLGNIPKHIGKLKLSMYLYNGSCPSFFTPLCMCEQNSDKLNRILSCILLAQKLQRLKRHLVTVRDKENFMSPGCL